MRHMSAEHYLLAKSLLLRQVPAMILAARIFLVVISALMLSAPAAHAAMTIAPEHAAVESAGHCPSDQAVCLDLEFSNDHAADHEQSSSCCAMSCHAAVQPCFEHSTFLAVVRMSQIPGLSRDLTASLIGSLERPPRIS
jgi:hypothetical protein